MVKKTVPLLCTALIAGVSVALFYQNHYPVEAFDEPVLASNLPNVVEGCADDTTIAVVDSLEHKPMRWKSNHYYIYTKLNKKEDPNNIYFGIWTANLDYGLDYALGGTYLSSDNPDLDKMDYELSDECKDLLHKSVKKWKKNYIFTQLK